MKGTIDAIVDPRSNLSPALHLIVMLAHALVVLGIVWGIVIVVSIVAGAALGLWLSRNGHEEPFVGSIHHLETGMTNSVSRGRRSRQPAVVRDIRGR